MSREVRRVPADWDPREIKNAYGHVQPHFDEVWEDAFEEYVKSYESWKAGTHPDFAEYGKAHSFLDWVGGPPDPDYYRPRWPDESRTHFMMYSTTSEGSPMSPAFATIEELAHWLADTKASAFGSMTATYEEWLAMCQQGHSIASGVMINGEMLSGVSAVSHV